MKKSKLVLFVILLLLVFILSGCAVAVTKTGSTANTKAILLLPDGTVIKGTCTDYQRVSDNWLIATVDGIIYKLSGWQIVFIEEKATEVK